MSMGKISLSQTDFSHFHLSMSHLFFFFFFFFCLISHAMWIAFSPLLVSLHESPQLGMIVCILFGSFFSALYCLIDCLSSRAEIQAQIKGI
jgi:apolipoprotein N-acyltransferase